MPRSLTTLRFAREAPQGDVQTPQLPNHRTAASPSPALRPHPHTCSTPCVNSWLCQIFINSPITVRAVELLQPGELRRRLSRCLLAGRTPHGAWPRGHSQTCSFISWTFLYFSRFWDLQALCHIPLKLAGLRRPSGMDRMNTTSLGNKKAQMRRAAQIRAGKPQVNPSGAGAMGMCCAFSSEGKV